MEVEGRNIHFYALKHLYLPKSIKMTLTLCVFLNASLFSWTSFLEPMEPILIRIWFWICLWISEGSVGNFGGLTASQVIKGMTTNVLARTCTSWSSTHASLNSLISLYLNTNMVKNWMIKNRKQSIDAHSRDIFGGWSPAKK